VISFLSREKGKKSSPIPLEEGKKRKKADDHPALRRQASEEGDR